MKKFFTTLFVILIVAFAIFSFFRYSYLLKINYSLELKLQEINEKIVNLEVAKKNLEEILDKKKEEYLELSKEKQALEANFKDTASQLEAKNSELEVIKQQLGETKINFENLNKEYASLKQEIGQLQQDKDTLKLTFSSLAELKKAYADFKQKFQEAKIDLIKAKDKKNLEEGNKGYLTFEGKPTTFKKIKIEVNPVFENR